MARRSTRRSSRAQASGSSARYFTPFVSPICSPSSPFPVARQPKELAQLRTLHDDRLKPVKGLSRLLTEPVFYDPPPAGAALRPGAGPISTGVDLATLFEAETPGLWHRHVLNVILDPRVPNGAASMLSPPRQALIWAALDVAIVSALSAAWYFKWVGATGVSYRQRPVEFDPSFPVLFDLVPRFPDRITPRPNDPAPSPGTPRHPAYPSGHSTYSAAASRVLGCLFDGYEDPRDDLAGLDWNKEFETLADNIGIARLYGGVHWESDHRFGQTVGKAVGDLVIGQLNRSGIAPQANSPVSPPKPSDVKDQAKQFASHCGEARNAFCGNFAPRGVQRMQRPMTLDREGGAAKGAAESQGS
jgi:hypothetical protein